MISSSRLEEMTSGTERQLEHIAYGELSRPMLLHEPETPSRTFASTSTCYSSLLSKSVLGQGPRAQRFYQQRSYFGDIEQPPRAGISDSANNAHGQKRVPAGAMHYAFRYEDCHPHDDDGSGHAAKSADVKRKPEGVTRQVNCDQQSGRLGNECG